MAINVLGNTTAASTSAVKPRVSVAVVDPSAALTAVLASASMTAETPIVGVSAVAPSVGVTYLLPATSVAYIALGVTMSLDITGKFKFVADHVTSTDGFRFALAKTFDEAVSVSSSTRIEFEKAAIQETISLSEVFTKLLIYARTLTDTQGLTDATVLSIGRAIADAVTMVEQRSMSFSRPVFDTFTTSDNVAKSFSRALTDSYAVADLRRIAFSRPVTDSAAVSDAVLTILHKTISDLVYAQDDAIRFVQKLLGDGVAMNDGFDAGDGAVYSFSKGISNVTIVADATAKTPAKGLSEQVSFADGGVLTKQDYCDITYFAEDYVGERIVF